MINIKSRLPFSAKNRILTLGSELATPAKQERLNCIAGRKSRFVYRSTSISSSASEPMSAYFTWTVNR